MVFNCEKFLVVYVGRRSICSPLQSLLKNDLVHHDPFSSLKIVAFIERLISLFLFFVKVLRCYFIYYELLK